MIDTCAHCGIRIVKLQFVEGAKWMHSPGGSSFNELTYIFCKRSVAEPISEVIETPTEKAKRFFDGLDRKEDLFTDRPDLISVITEEMRHNYNKSLTEEE